MGNPLFTLLGYALNAVSFICFIFIVIDAFRKEVWKGLLTFFCCFYAIYYAFAEFESEHKTKIIIGWLVAGTLGGALIAMSGFPQGGAGVP